MATLALAVLGSKVATTIAGSATAKVIGGITAAGLGSSIGGFVGGILDQQLIFPALFNQRADFAGPQIQDLKLQTAEDGANALKSYGRVGRSSGNVLWISETRTKEVKQEKPGKGGGGGSRTVGYNYFVDIAILVAKNPTDRILKVFANNEPFLQETEADTVYDSLTYYYGGDNQTSDPTIQANYVYDYPAWRGWSYVVIKNLNLSVYGNGIPQFSFIYETDSEATVGTVITDILKDARWFDEYFNTSSLNLQDELGGLIVSGNQSPAKKLETLAVSDQIKVVDREGVLVFDQVDYTVDFEPDEIGFEDYDAEDFSSVPYTLTVREEFNKPIKLVLKYIDPENDYQQGSVFARKHNKRADVWSNNTVPMTLTVDKAQSIAQRLLYQPWINNKEMNFKGGPEYLALEVGDLVRIDNIDIRVTNISVGRNFLVEVKGLSDSAIDSLLYENEGSAPANNIFRPSENLRVEIINVGPLRDQDVLTPGFYVAAQGLDRAVNFFQIYAGPDDQNLSLVASTLPEAIMGEADTTLADSTNLYDTTNTVDVTVTRGVLASSDNVQNGTNWAILGDEIIAFETVQDLGSNQFRLSNIYRGLRDTHLAKSTHTSNDRFIMLENLRFVDLPVTNFNNAYFVQAVPNRGIQVRYPVIGTAFVPRNVLPFTPINLMASAVGNDWFISWTGNSRYPRQATLENSPTAVSPEPKIEYLIEFYNGVNLIRSEVVQDAFFTYTATMQTADGLTPPGTVSVKVCQIGKYGNSYPAEISVS